MPGPGDHLVSIDEIEQAAGRIRGRVHRTPILSSSTAAAWVTAATGVRIADGRLYLKAEQLQKTGSFKPRGMTNRVLTLDPAELGAGVITLSAGNAGQAYAWAGRSAGVKVTVVMPAEAVRSKVDACRGYGARVVLHGAHVGETFAEMERIRDAEGLRFVHPFDDPAVIAGHGSIGLELLEDLPAVDVVVVGVGGGGLISGIAAALKERRPTVRVYGVEPERSNAVSLGMERNEVVRIQPESVADGLGAPFAGEWTIALCRRYLDGVVLLDDPTILAGMRFAVERLKQVLEPAGAAALAATLAGKIPIGDGDRVAVVLSGGNVETSRLGELLAGAADLPGGNSRFRRLGSGAAHSCTGRPTRRRNPRVASLLRPLVHRATQTTPERAVLVPQGLVDPELVQPVVVDAEVMGQLVDHGLPDLVGEVVGIREVLLQR